MGPKKKKKPAPTPAVAPPAPTPTAPATAAATSSASSSVSASVIAPRSASPTAAVGGGAVSTAVVAAAAAAPETSTLARASSVVPPPAPVRIDADALAAATLRQVVGDSMVCDEAGLPDVRAIASALSIDPQQLADKIMAWEHKLFQSEPSLQQWVATLPSMVAGVPTCAATSTDAAASAATASSSTAVITAAAAGANTNAATTTGPSGSAPGKLPTANESASSAVVGISDPQQQQQQQQQAQDGVNAIGNANLTQARRAQVRQFLDKLEQAKEHVRAPIRRWNAVEVVAWLRACHFPADFVTEVERRPLTGAQLASMDENALLTRYGITSGLLRLKFRVCLERARAAVLVTIDELKERRTIGVGAFGSVYECDWVRGSPEPVAVKKLYEQPVQPQHQSVFRQEVRMLTAHSDPHVVQLIAYCASPAAIVTELMDTNLFDVLHVRMKTLTPQQIRHIALRIARGVVSLHRRYPDVPAPPIVVRDLKSRNVLLSKDFSEVKISDAGFTRTKTISGQLPIPMWLAPEVIRGVPFGCRADTYSFAMVLYELFFNRVPYDSVPIQHLYEHVVTKGERPELPPHYALRIPQAWLKLMRACWDADPNKRPQMTTVLDKLKRLIPPGEWE